jgi:SynChlorMet cassette radical SAM/SPASM protein ScmF
MSTDPTALVGSWPLGMLYVYLTESCNLACRHCWIQPTGQGTAPAGQNLPVDTLESIVAQAAPLGLQAVKLTGGEPLLHPEIREILEMLARQGLACVLETNGTLISSAIAARLAQVPHPQVTVSLDGADAATHEGLRRVPGCFAATLKGIRELTAAGLRPQIIMTLMRGNEGQPEAVVRLAESLGAGSVKFNVMQPVGRGKELLAAGQGLPIEDLLSLARWVEQDLAERTNLPLFFHHPLAFQPLSRIFAERSLGCGQCGIRGILGVLADGSYALCGIGRRVPELVFGGAAAASLREVWESHPTLTELRRGLPARLQGICGDCLMKHMCLGGCLAYNYEAHGSFWGPFWYCRQAWEAGRFPASRLAGSPAAREGGQ